MAGGSLHGIGQAGVKRVRGGQAARAPRTGCTRRRGSSRPGPVDLQRPPPSERDGWSHCTDDRGQGRGYPGRCSPLPAWRGAERSPRPRSSPRSPAGRLGTPRPCYFTAEKTGLRGRGHFCEDTRGLSCRDKIQTRCPHHMWHRESLPLLQLPWVPAGPGWWGQGRACGGPPTPGQVCRCGERDARSATGRQRGLGSRRSPARDSN